MIFSDKIFKIVSGKNLSVYANNSNELNLYIYDKMLKLYKISINSNMKCVFYKSFNYEKIIQLDSNFCICSNNYITLSKEIKL